MIRLGSLNRAPSKSNIKDSGKQELKTSRDFMKFVDGVSLYSQAQKEGLKFDEKRIYGSKPGYMQKTFNENINLWLETLKSTDDTLDKDKKKLR